MSRTTVKKISNADLLDRLKEGFSYKTDLEVAGFLGVSKDTISMIRREVIGLSLAQRIKIMDRLQSIKVRNLLVRITPENLADGLIRLSNKGAEALAFEDIEAGEATEDDIELIKLFKEFGNLGKSFATDKEMAAYLGLKRNTISSVRAGDGRLGPLPRLRMLKAICPNADIEQIERGIESSEYLFNLISEHIEQKQQSACSDLPKRTSSDTAFEADMFKSDSTKH